MRVGLPVLDTGQRWPHHLYKLHPAPDLCDGPRAWSGGQHLARRLPILEPAKWPEVCRWFAHCGRSHAADDESSSGVKGSEGKGDTEGFFDNKVTDATTQARTLLLALLRDRRPGDDARPALTEAVGSYLRQNPDDAEMKEAWEGFTGLPATVVPCAHNGFLLVEPVDGGCAVRCVLCGTVGPVRNTVETARKALLVLGTRNPG
jgi:hypothetical protein